MFIIIDMLMFLLMLCILSQHSSTVAVERWLGMVLSMLLLLICHGKEDVVLTRLEDLELCMPPPGCLYGPVERHDPLNVAATIPKCKQLPPEQIMARLVIFLKTLLSDLYSEIFLQHL